MTDCKQEKLEHLQRQLDFIMPMDVIWVPSNVWDAYREKYGRDMLPPRKPMRDMPIIPRSDGVMPEHKLVQKGWGSEEWIVNTEDYCGKILRFNVDSKCSLHLHPVKDETMYVLYGKVIINYGDGGIREAALKSGESFHIPPGMSHRISTSYGIGATIIEFSTHHDDGDCVRLSPGDSQDGE